MKFYAIAAIGFFAAALSGCATNAARKVASESETYIQRPDGGKTFYDSSFSHPKTVSFCYVGKVSEVCGVIKKNVEAIQQGYAMGGHDTVELRSCEIKADDAAVVAVAYNASDDYGGNFDVKVDIAACK
jgi:hypothetical protein